MIIPTCILASPLTFCSSIFFPIRIRSQLRQDGRFIFGSKCKRETLSAGRCEDVGR